MKCNKCDYFDKNNLKCTEDVRIKMTEKGYECEYEEFIEKKMRKEKEKIPRKIIDLKKVDGIRCDDDDIEYFIKGEWETLYCFDNEKDCIREYKKLVRKYKSIHKNSLFEFFFRD